MVAPLRSEMSYVKDRLEGIAKENDLLRDQVKWVFLAAFFRNIDNPNHTKILSKNWNSETLDRVITIEELLNHQIVFYKFSKISRFARLDQLRCQYLRYYILKTWKS